MFLGHGGGGYGYSLNQTWLPEHGIGAVVLTNQQEHGFLHELLVRNSLELMLNKKQFYVIEPEKEVVKYKPVVELGEESLRKFEGNYEIYRGFFVSVSLEDGRLFLNTVGKSSELRPHSPTEFSMEDGVKISFELDEDGRPTSFLYLDSFRHAWYNDGHNDDPGPNEEEWEKHVGAYRAKYYGNYSYSSIIVKNGWLYLDFFGAYRLKHYRDNLYFTPEGEALTLNRDSINYRNIGLEKVDITVDDILDVYKVDKNSRLLYRNSLLSLAYAMLELEGIEPALTLLDMIVDLRPSIFTSKLEPGYFDYYNQMAAIYTSAMNSTMQKGVSRDSLNLTPGTRKRIQC